MSWNKNTLLDGYEIYQTSSVGAQKTLVKTQKRTTAYVKNLKGGKTYFFSVRGWKNVDGNKQYTIFSPAVKVTMPNYKKNSTIKTLLKTALKPVGKTVYVWGGGWNKADTGAGTPARRLGISSRWKTFFKKQNSSYNYNNTRYQINDGLDCSGYIGWLIYNTFETKNGKTGYVMYADRMAKNYSDRGWGSYTPKYNVRNWKAGDIMSSSGHVYIVVGSCSDGSVVLMHASPPGVFICGTATPGGNSSKAQSLAKSYMKKYFPDYYRKFPNCTRGSSYLRDYNQMRWDVTGNRVMSDPDGYTKMSADKILKDLFRK